MVVFFLRADPMPNPKNANPKTGISDAYHNSRPAFAPVVTGRAVVAMVNVEETDVALGVTGFVENVHVTPEGNVAGHAIETLFGNPAADDGFTVT